MTPQLRMSTDDVREPLARLAAASTAIASASSVDELERVLRQETARVLAAGDPPAIARLLHAQLDQLGAIRLEHLRMQEAMRQRDLFLGVLAHDLRSPLAAITTGLNVLVQGSLDRLPRTVERMKSCADRMARMIDHVLDLTQSTATGTIGIRRSAGDLHEICRGLIDQLQLGAADGRVEAIYEGDARGAWDADRIAEVLTNLIENALTHGDPTTPVRVEVRGMDPDRVAIQVSNGGAIAPEMLSTLFDPFKRAHQPKNRQTKGLGLGLYITRQIVAAHGGTIDVVSTPEAGTTFRIMLPRCATP